MNYLNRLRQPKDCKLTPACSSSSESSLKSKTTKTLGHIWTSVVYSRWFNELPTLANPNSLFWLLGRSYTESQKENFNCDYKSRLYLSYRENFPSLNERNVQSDIGWGCTLRSAQMLIAQALMIDKLSREWVRLDVTPSDLLNIVRLFEDCKTAPLGLHALISVAKKLGYEEPTGKWYSPSQAFILLKNAMEQSHSPLLNHNRIALCVDNCVATQEIINLSDNWSKNIMLIVPVRLGTEKVNEVYFNHIRTLFQMPMFLGLVGGRPKRAVYFVGFVENTLFQLDPHICQKYVKLDGTESNQHLETFHSKNIFTMPFKDMDPSCALGFLIKSDDGLKQFVDFLIESGIADNESVSSSNSLFSIVSERPVFDLNKLSGSVYNKDTDFEII